MSNFVVLQVTSARQGNTVFSIMLRGFVSFLSGELIPREEKSIITSAGYKCKARKYSVFNYVAWFHFFSEW